MSNRLALLVAATVAAVVSTVITLSIRTPAASQPQVVRTRALEITDARGRVRITLDAFVDRPAVWLYDDSHARRIGLTINSQGIPEVTLLDSQGRARLLLRVGAERAAELRITDSLGHLRIGAWVDYRDDPGIWMFDSMVRPRIGLKVIGGDPRLWIFEHDTGRVIFTAP